MNSTDIQSTDVLADVEAPDVAISICCIIAAIGGLTMNGILITLIARNKELRRKAHIIFILNRALIDFTYCLHLGILQPIAILAFEPSSNVCVVAGFLENTLGLTSICAEPLLACNRYISTIKNDHYKKIYTRRNVYLMCAFVWILGPTSIVPHVFIENSFGRVAGSFCSFNFSLKTLILFLSANYSLILLGLGSIVFFNYEMYFFLNKYKEQALSTSQRTKLQGDREMLRFIFAAAVIPLILQAPAATVAFVRMVMPLSGWIMFAALGVFTISFVVDPMLSLLMVRPIRTELTSQFRKVLGKQNQVTTTQVEAISRITQPPN